MSNLKMGVQRFGRFLSNMVMPNIGAFIAWGFITALFIPTGWTPHAEMAKLVGPMITYLLPILIGYCGGKLIHGERGAVVGAVSTMGVVVSADIPMFLGAMIIGPIGGWAIKIFDRCVEGKIKSGFEMLVNNFSAGIIGMIVALIGFWVIGPVVLWVFKSALTPGLKYLVESGLLPLTSIAVEPAKIMFLNNAINHGIFNPIATTQVQEMGKSLVFLIEANPGPGLGLLLAYIFFGRGTAKYSAGSASIIHFFGGIHEIYFPFVLMNPALLIAMIAGGATGIFMLTAFDAGLTAAASPGSIFAVLAMTQKGSHLGVICSVFSAAAVSFVIASMILKFQKEDGSSLEDAQAQSKALKNKPVDVSGGLNHVYVACDAGMGSSAMGAGMLRKKVQDAGLNITVSNCAINNLPADARLVITHQDLTPLAQKRVPNAQHLSLKNFLDHDFYNQLVADLKNNTANTAVSVEKSASSEEADLPPATYRLTADHVHLGLSASNKEEAIRLVGQKLWQAGFVEYSYINAMLEREKIQSTYMGEGIAVPHGTIEAKEAVLKTGIVFCQFPAGITFEDESAYLLIGIGAKNNEHVQVIAKVISALDSEEVLNELKTTTDVEAVLKYLR